MMSLGFVEGIRSFFLIFTGWRLIVCSIRITMREACRVCLPAGSYIQDVIIFCIGDGDLLSPMMIQCLRFYVKTGFIQGLCLIIIIIGMMAAQPTIRVTAVGKV